MANKVLLKKSSVAAKVPLTTDLDYGELALNYADEKLYFKNSSNAIKSFNVTNSTLTISTGLSGTSYNGSSAVTIALASGYGDTLNPYASKTMNTVLAAPQNANGVPTFRNLHLSDMPSAWIKRAVNAATTGALTLNTAQTTIDGVTLSATSRVLVKNQAAPAENGIYTNVTTTSWTRTEDADTVGDIAGAFVNVDAGTVNGGKSFDTDFKSTDTLGTTAMTWYQNVDTGLALTSGSTTVDGYIRYAGTTATAGQFDGGTTTPTGTTRLNYGGYFYPTYINLVGSADTATAATHYFVETGTDGFVRPKTLANVKTEIVTTAAVNAAAATTVGTVTSGTWNATTIAVAYGGTGVTTSTGSGSNVLNTSPTLVTPVIGAATGTSLTLSGALQAATKSFLIPHPTKPNMKLRYGSLEGPENGVYVRGKLNGDTIELPDYWINLVDETTITVNLTPIGSHQKLYVKDIVDNRVLIGNENLLSKEINCFYVVYAERKDVDKLEVEIE